MTSCSLKICVATTETIYSMYEVLSCYLLITSFWIWFRYAGFQEWVQSLPELLCAPTIPATTVEVLAKFACQNNLLFYKSLCQKLPDILSKLVIQFTYISRN